MSGNYKSLTGYTGRVGGTVTFLELRSSRRPPLGFRTSTAHTSPTEGLWARRPTLTGSGQQDDEINCLGTCTIDPFLPCRTHLRDGVPEVRTTKEDRGRRDYQNPGTGCQEKSDGGGTTRLRV